MTNSIVWDLKKSWNEKGTHFCYKIHYTKMSQSISFQIDTKQDWKWISVLTASSRFKWQNKWEKIDKNP